MKPMHFAMALLSAAMFFVLAGVFMGVQLELDGTKLVVDTAADIRWQWIFIGTAVVFLFQMLRPVFQKTLKSVSGRNSFCRLSTAQPLSRSCSSWRCWWLRWRGRLWSLAVRSISRP